MQLFTILHLTEPNLPWKRFSFVSHRILIQLNHGIEAEVLVPVEPLIANATEIYQKKQKFQFKP